FKKRNADAGAMLQRLEAVQKPLDESVSPAALAAGKVDAAAAKAHQDLADAVKKAEAAVEQAKPKAGKGLFAAPDIAGLARYQTAVANVGLAANKGSTNIEQKIALWRPKAVGSQAAVDAALAGLAADLKAAVAQGGADLAAALKASGINP